MKGNKLEPLYLILSIALLAITGFFYLSNSKKEAAVQPTITQTSTSSSQEKEKEETSDKTISEKIADLTKRLAEIAKNPSKDSVASIKKEIQALEKGSNKTKLLKSLADVEKDLATIASIEANLGLAQNSGETGYLQTAQTAIDSLKAETKKAELQARLNEIAATLATSQTETSSESETEEVLEEVESGAEETLVQEEVTNQEVYTPSYTDNTSYYSEPSYTYTPSTPSTPTNPTVTVPSSTTEPSVTTPEEPTPSPEVETPATPSEPAETSGE